MQIHHPKRTYFPGRVILSAAILFLALLLSPCAFALAAPSEYADPIYTETGERDYSAEMTARKLLPVESNLRENWPQGPVVGAEGVCLMEADTGLVLYDKNMHKQLYPASTTKLMTCLLAVENLSLSDTITFTESSLSCLGDGASNIGMDLGQSITVEEALYGILVGSANEVSAAVAEKTAGSTEAFAEMMNEKAAELGCTDTHFVNSNGLFDADHYTSSYDLALIARAFFANDTLRRMGNTASYHFSATATQPDDFTLTNKHQLITGETSCEGVIGGKTGYTEASRETLVTGCERNGMRLICVVMMEESPYQFTDTVSLFDYGYSQFSKVSITDADIVSADTGVDFLTSGRDILGNSSPLFSVADGSSVILPYGFTLSDLACSVSPAEEDSGAICEFDYKLGDVNVGKALIRLTDSGNSASSLASSSSGEGTGISGSGNSSADTSGSGNSSVNSSGSAAGFLFDRLPFSLSDSLISAGVYYINDSGTLYLNVRIILTAFALLGGLLILIIQITSFINSYTTPIRARKKRHRRQTKLDNDRRFTDVRGSRDRY